MMNNMYNLLFELSNPDRVRILLKTQDTPSRLTKIAELLDLTVQETSRHLSRLSDAKLISKNVDGSYGLTPYGVHTLRLLPGFQFLSKNRDYLITHNITHLPDAFVMCIGNLVNCSFTDEVMVAFHLVNSLIQEAQEYIWILSDQILMSTLPYLEQTIKRGVKFRLMLPQDLTPPPGFKPIPIIPNLIERRTLKNVDVILIISEQNARIAFPKHDKKMDHIGFGSTDESSLSWCKDLFLYYWEQATIGEPSGYPKSSNEQGG